MKTVLVKGIKEEDWTVFKTEAAAHNMKMAEFLSLLLKEHSKKSHAKDRWKRILTWRSGKSKEALDEMQKAIDLTRRNVRLER